jgi:hypothetical protein
VRELLHAPIPEQVQAGVAHMAGHQPAVPHEGGRHHARHAGPLRLALREAEYLVVGEGDGLPQLLFRRARLPVEPGPHHPERGFRSPFAGRLAPYAVDDDEQAAFGVAVVAVFVVLPAQPGVAHGGGGERRAIRGRDGEARLRPRITPGGDARLASSRHAVGWPLETRGCRRLERPGEHRQNLTRSPRLWPFRTSRHRPGRSTLRSPARSRSPGRSGRAAAPAPPRWCPASVRPRPPCSTGPAPRPPSCRGC